MAAGNGPTFPGLANIEGILRQITTVLGQINTSVGNVNAAITAVFPPALSSSTAFTPGSIAAGASVTHTITVAGATVGEISAASFSNSLNGILLSSYVSAANTVTAVFYNPTASPIVLGAGTILANVYH